MNGVDLSLFDFDYDLTWMGFFMNPDERIYSRYGGRAEEDAMTLLSPAGLKRNMQAVMDVHRRWLANPEPAPPPRNSTSIDDLPLAQDVIQRWKRENKTNECFHCHNVNDYRMRQQIAGKTFDPAYAFAYPPPHTLGFHIDRLDSTRVQDVADSSPAAQAGLQANDRITQVSEMAILSVGDLLYALNAAPPEGDLPLAVTRANGETAKLTVKLAKGWRQHDISWRAKLFNLQPEPGVWAPEITDERRRELNLPGDALALEARYIHKPWAQNSGLRNGDIIIASNGDTTRRKTNEWQMEVRLHCEPGSNLVLTVLRNGERKEITIPLPK